MQRFKHYLLTAIAFVVLTAAFSFGQPKDVDAAAHGSVTVDNTEGNPVPVVTQGITAIRGSVVLAGTPTVQAAQAGAWSVSVANSPSVSIVGTPSVYLAGIPAVTIAGAPQMSLAPGATVNVVLPHDRDPVVVTAGVESDAGTFYLEHELYVVPEGKLLVIENINGTIGGAGLGIIHVSLYMNRPVFIPATVQSPDGDPFRFFVWNQQVTWFQGAGGSVLCMIRKANPVYAGGTCGFSGYLTDM